MRPLIASFIFLFSLALIIIFAPPPNYNKRLDTLDNKNYQIEQIEYAGVSKVMKGGVDHVEGYSFDIVIKLLPDSQMVFTRLMPAKITITEEDVFKKEIETDDTYLITIGLTQNSFDKIAKEIKEREGVSIFPRVVLFDTRKE